jgi:hypothetical protein
MPLQQQAAARTALPAPLSAAAPGEKGLLWKQEGGRTPAGGCREPAPA